MAGIREGLTVVSRPVTPLLDLGRNERAKLGFVVLANEQTVETDVFRLAPKGVGVHFTRMPMSDTVTLDTLACMAPDIEASASLLLPDGELDAVCYTCNSGTMVIGEKEVMASLSRGCKNIEHATTVMTGVMRGLAALNARRISIITPYSDTVNSLVARFLTDNGFDILEFQGLNLTRNSDIDLVSPGFLKEYGASVDRPKADAVVLCCGALRALDVVQELEDELGKPVVSSNQAMMWDCLRLAKIPDVVPGYGRLMALDCAAHHAAVELLTSRKLSLE